MNYKSDGVAPPKPKLRFLMRQLCVLVLALFWASGNARSENCSPPNFYSSLPRDREWFYGVARDTNTDNARDAAVKNLGKQVSGGIAGWDERQIEKIAGPGRDRSAVGQAIETTLSQTPLSGWEQDDFQRCKGFSYVLVRVQKERALKFLVENAIFRNAVLERLENRVAQIGDDVASVKVAYQKLHAELEELKRDQGKGRVPIQIGTSRDRVERLLLSVKKGLGT